MLSIQLKECKTKLVELQHENTVLSAQLDTTSLSLQNAERMRMSLTNLLSEN